MRNYWYIRPWEASEVVADSALCLMVIACIFWAVAAVGDAIAACGKRGDK